MASSRLTSLLETFAESSRLLPSVKVMKALILSLRCCLPRTVIFNDFGGSPVFHGHLIRQLFTCHFTSSLDSLLSGALMKFLCDITVLQLMKFVFPLGIKHPFEINESLVPKLLLNFVSSVCKKYLDLPDSCQNRDLTSLANLHKMVGRTTQ